MNWENYRDKTDPAHPGFGSLDLITAFAEYCPPAFKEDRARIKACKYIQEVMNLQPINSRQVAASVLANAYIIWMEN